MEIRIAKLEDKKDIINFIKEYWKKDHIFVLDENFFDYYYCNESCYNIIIAKEGNEVQAILGYIKYFYDSDEVFLALWKSLKNTMAGIKCLEFLMSKYKISCCGINKKTVPIYKFFNINTGRLKHFYKLNLNITDYKIAKIFSTPTVKVRDYHFEAENKMLQILSKEILERIYNKIPKKKYYKSLDYFSKMYFENPYYKYIVLGLKNDENEIKTIVVLREIMLNNRKCLRIIDIIGEESLLFILNNYIEQKFMSTQYEYIDIYEIGLQDETLKNMGFVEREEKDNNIIPNYFEPFEQKNVEIYYASHYKENFRMFKGDGDQDRPSLIRM